jgi:GNAT superfamily N-acetyltransferase
MSQDAVWLLRPMYKEDAAAADQTMQAALVAGPNASESEHAVPPDDGSRRDRMIAVLGHFVKTDPAGCWVAEWEGEMLGMAVSIRRQDFWGLAMLFVLPEAQNLGIGRALLEACARYADGCSRRMIMSSNDPRSARTYSAHGLEVHPAMTALGSVDRSRLALGAPGRAGSSRDLPLVDEVDTIVRGSSRAVDVEFLLSEGAALTIIDDETGRGYAAHAAGAPVVGGHPIMLGATTEIVAGQLLRQVFALAKEPIEVFGLTRRQGWAIRVALEARLTVRPSPPLFMTPGLEPPGPWLLSGIYF